MLKSVLFRNFCYHIDHKIHFKSTKMKRLLIKKIIRIKKSRMSDCVYDCQIIYVQTSFGLIGI